MARFIRFQTVAPWIAAGTIYYVWEEYNRGNISFGGSKNAVKKMEKEDLFSKKEQQRWNQEVKLSKRQGEGQELRKTQNVVEG